MKNNKVLVLHAYSSANKGDGLLVQEALVAIREALGKVEIDLVATDPESFLGLGLNTIIPVFFRKPIWSFAFMRTLAKANAYGIVVGVGGGYLRGKTLLETLKFGVVHLPQIWAASRSRSLYLPQSIGPFGPLSAPLVKSFVGKLDAVFVRDDRSFDFLDSPVSRSCDMALRGVATHSDSGVSEIHPVPIVTTKGGLSAETNQNIKELANSFSRVDTYVQSKVSSNNDTHANSLLGAKTVVESLDRPGNLGKPRLVIAVRLHAALMALAQGHFVVHLAYERKGFGAFQDLGLDDFVFNVKDFDLDKVLSVSKGLLSSNEQRAKYLKSINEATPKILKEREKLLLEIREIYAR